jgi:hypothetical protein
VFVGGGGGSFGLESVGEPVGLGQVGGEPIPRLLGLPVQAFEAEQVPERSSGQRISSWWMRRS